MQMQNRGADQTRSHAPHEWPIMYLLGGLVIGFFGLWGWSVQILTSEALFAGSHVDISLLPHFGVFGQIAVFWNGGGMRSDDIPVYMWGWGVQIVQLICSVGLEFPRRNRWVDLVIAILIALTIGLNSLSDFQYMSKKGLFQQVGFTLMCFMMSFAVGKFAIHYIFKGINDILANMQRRI